MVCRNVQWEHLFWVSFQSSVWSGVQLGRQTLSPSKLQFYFSLLVNVSLQFRSSSGSVVSKTRSNLSYIMSVITVQKGKTTDLTDHNLHPYTRQTHTASFIITIIIIRSGIRLPVTHQASHHTPELRIWLFKQMKHGTLKIHSKEGRPLFRK